MRQTGGLTRSRKIKIRHNPIAQMVWRTNYEFWYAYLNGNASRRNLNVNQDHPDEQWNDNCRFLRRYYLYFSKYLSQPPSILPISASGEETLKYFLWSRSFNSQAICKRNFNVSNWTLASWMNINFCGFDAWLAFVIDSIVFKNSLSISAPSVYLDKRGN